MKSRFLRGIICLLLTVGLVTAPCFLSLADEYDEQIEAMKGNEAKTQETISILEKQTQQTKEAITLLQGQRQATEENVNDLQKQSSSLKNTIEGYSEKLDVLGEEIRDTEDAMSDVSSEIVKLNDELSEIRRERDERYALLKKRVRSVYESGGGKGMMRLMLETGFFGDLMSRAEYFSAVVQYDQKVMAECQALEDQLNEKLSVVHEKEEELDVYQESLDTKYDELEGLTDEVMGELASTNNSLSSEAKKIENYDEQLATLDKTMKAIEAQTAAAQAELAKQVAARLALKREDTSGAYSASGTELEWLAATIQAEADGESYTGKLAVGSVIMNRVKSSAFPNSIVGVITQNMQFASYRSGKVELIMAKGPNSTCVKAAQEVLGGARVGDYLFFMTKYYADYYGISEYTMIGNHAFFYSWTVKPKTDPVAPETPVTEQPAENGGEQETEQGQDNGEDENAGEDSGGEGEESGGEDSGGEGENTSGAEGEGDSGDGGDQGENS
ncbi:MAG: cell wall hydrolase [Lachnospiraceae bacterium]|nr:cell wall hydrolase [Lachnospiraceae bacterium]